MRSPWRKTGQLNVHSEEVIFQKSFLVKLKGGFLILSITPSTSRTFLIHWSRVSKGEFAERKHAYQVYFSPIFFHDFVCCDILKTAKKPFGEITCSSNRGLPILADPPTACRRVDVPADKAFDADDIRSRSATLKFIVGWLILLCEKPDTV